MISGRNVMAIYRGEGNGNDDGPNGVDLAPIAGGVVYTTGKAGQAFDFGGGVLAATSPAAMTATTALTICAWVRMSVTLASGWQFIAAKRVGGGAPDNYSFEIGIANKPSLWATNAGVFRGIGSTESSTINVWTHWGMVYDAGTVNFYKNGIITGTSLWQAASMYTALEAGTENFMLGGNSGNGSRLNGDVDNVVLYKRALPESDVRRLMLGLHPLT